MSKQSQINAQTRIEAEYGLKGRVQREQFAARKSKNRPHYGDLKDTKLGGLKLRKQAGRRTARFRMSKALLTTDVDTTKLSEASLDNSSTGEHVDVPSSKNAPPTPTIQDTPQLDEYHLPKPSQPLQSTPTPREESFEAKSDDQGTGTAEPVAAKEAERDAVIDAEILRLIRTHGKRHFKAGYQRFLKAEDAKYQTWRDEEYRPVLTSESENERAYLPFVSDSPQSAGVNSPSGSVQDDSGNDGDGNGDDGNGDDENGDDGNSDDGNDDDGSQDPGPAHEHPQIASISFTFNHCVVQGVYQPLISDSPNAAGDV